MFNFVLKVDELGKDPSMQPSMRGKELTLRERSVKKRKELTQRAISQDWETATSLSGMVSVDKAGVPTEIFILKHRGETALKLQF